MDKGLSNKPPTDCESQPPPFLLLHTQHSPLLYYLYTHDCSPVYPGHTIITFADDTAVVGLITGGDETDYRNEVPKLT